jgi:hypothetical protein
MARTALKRLGGIVEVRVDQKQESVVFEPAFNRGDCPKTGRKAPTRGTPFPVPATKPYGTILCPISGRGMEHALSPPVDIHVCNPV